jgi:serine phosphatase RsbU (regulator of sigma subunit)
MHEVSAVGRLTPAPSIQAISRPARTFTGDFYVAHREGERLWIAQGDVAGKGLPAAVVMAMIQEELEHRVASCARTLCNPAVMMQRLHEFLLPLLPANRFVTAVIAYLDVDGTLTIANAGHMPPLILRQDGRVESIGSTGPVAGILPAATWSAITTNLAHDETLLLYSDGVTEALAGDDELGVDGLRQRLAANRDPRTLLHALETCDDATVVAVRR